MSNGFTVICNDCQTNAKLKTKDERVTEEVLVLIHFSGVRLVCTKCHQQLVLD